VRIVPQFHSEERLLARPLLVPSTQLLLRVPTTPLVHLQTAQSAEIAAKQDSQDYRHVWREQLLANWRHINRERATTLQIREQTQTVWYVDAAKQD